MDKRYQVFVSSTYTDLVSERQTAMLRLLELDCMPTGMELFPASDESAWELIESVIKASDYYVLILGGRYGSKSSDNPLSFTEREYDLAVKLGIPILTFLHQNPGKIEAEKTERTDAGREAFDKFRRKAQDGKHVKYWTTPQDLGGELMQAIIHAKKVRPRVGWIRADQAADPQTLKDLERVRREVDELRSQLAAMNEEAPASAANFAFGKQVPRILFTCEAYEDGVTEDSEPHGPYKRVLWNKLLGLSWEKIFRIVAPQALVANYPGAIHAQLNDWIVQFCQTDEWHKSHHSMSQRLPQHQFDLIKVQFLALGLWKLAQNPAGQTEEMWELTPHGRRVLVELLAMRRRSKQAE